MIKRICMIIIGLLSCGCIGYTIYKILHPMGTIKKAKIDPRFNFDEFIVN